jgi:hyperosmotically inducible protein
MRPFAVLIATVVLGAFAAEPPRPRLEKEVRHELVMPPFYGIFDNLAFRAEGQKISLIGEVTRPALKSDAERAVNRIEGVDIVENRLEVLPLSPKDDRIRVAAHRTIYGHAGLSRYALQTVPGIHIIVRNGHITLTGSVASKIDKNIAAIQANSVPGVFSVTEELRLDTEQ